MLARLKELEQKRTLREQPQADDLGLALENIGNLWEQFPNFVRREILRACVRGGFRVMGKRTVQAELCGVLLEADVPMGDDKHGPRPRGMRRLTWDEAKVAGLVYPDKQEDLPEERTGPLLVYTDGVLLPLSQGGQTIGAAGPEGSRIPVPDSPASYRRQPNIAGAGRASRMVE